MRGTRYICNVRPGPEWFTSAGRVLQAARTSARRVMASSLMRDDGRGLSCPMRMAGKVINFAWRTREPGGQDEKEASACASGDDHCVVRYRKPYCQSSSSSFFFEPW